MSNTGGRGTRHFFDGTGVYIALFLVVTALAVAGYWTLIPRSSTIDEPVVDETPSLPTVVTPIAAAEPENDPEPETALTMPELEPEPAAPAQSAVTLVLPPADAEPVAPSLIVDPLIGETVAAFSMEELRYSETMGDWRTHDGVDLAADLGTPVRAASTGTVIDVRDDDLMGTTVVLSHDGGYDTIYANLEAVPTVEVGDFVSAGQVVGSVGRTALSESALAPHLHFGVTKDGEYVDPAEFLK